MEDRVAPRHLVVVDLAACRTTIRLTLLTSRLRGSEATTQGVDGLEWWKFDREAQLSL